MNTKPVLYYSCINGVAFDNFCSDAAIGARDAGIDTQRFEDLSEVPYDPYNIVVASVEDTLQYLGKDIPVIDHSWAQEFLKRSSERVESISDITDFPCFIKPADQIKAFTGFIADSQEFAKMMSYDFQGPVLKQQIVSIEAEYRVYMSGLSGVISIHQYSGDPYNMMDKSFVQWVCKKAWKVLTRSPIHWILA